MNKTNYVRTREALRGFHLGCHPCPMQDPSLVKPPVPHAMEFGALINDVTVWSEDRNMLARVLRDQVIDKFGFDPGLETVQDVMEAVAAAAWVRNFEGRGGCVVVPVFATYGCKQPAARGADARG